MEDNFNEFQEDNQHQAAPVRPQLLTVVCILSFILIGLTTLGAAILSSPLAEPFILIQKSNPDFDAVRDVDIVTLLEGGWKYYVPMIILNLLELTGVIMMWKLKKNGFHFFAIANILLFFLPSLLLGIPLNIFSAILPAMFVGMYSLHFRFMK